MFQEDNLDAEIAFKTAVDRENMSHNKIFEFVPVIRRFVDPMDTYQAEKIGLYPKSINLNLQNIYMVKFISKFSLCTGIRRSYSHIRSKLNIRIK